MTPNRFRDLYEAHCRIIDNLLINKGQEYAPDQDRLHNFKAAAAFLHTNEREVCLSFLTKHLVSIVDMVKSSKVYTKEQWNEKIGDSITYHHLLWAMVEEHRGQDDLLTRTSAGCSDLPSSQGLVKS